MLGLGGSVATPPEGVEAPLLVVRSYEELESHAAKARGRIVLFNVPFTNYGETSRYRWNGASRAARHGAVAMLIRSVGPNGLRLPHTGALTYAADAPRIPAAAITTEDADRLQRMADRGDRIVIRLRMEAHLEPDVESANVVGEIRGRERPDEIVVVSGHLDSWDVGAGRDRRWRRLRGVVGSAAHHEEAQPEAAPYRPRRAVDQRGERRAAAASPIAISIGPNSPGTC